MEFVRQAQELLKEVQYTGTMYLDTYSFDDPGKIGGEKAWQEFGEVFLDRPGEDDIANSIRSLFRSQIDTLKMPCLLERHDALPAEQRRHLLQMRRRVLMDVRDSIRSLLELQAHLSTYAIGNRHKIAIMGHMIHDDVEHLMGMETQCFGEKAWEKSDFHKLVQKRAVGLKEARKQGLSPMSLPYLRTVVTSDGQYLGYIAGEFESIDVQYETVHGKMTGRRHRLELQTAGIRRDVDPIVIGEFIYDVLERAKKEYPHRIDNRLSAYHM